MATEYIGINENQIAGDRLNFKENKWPLHEAMVPALPWEA
jgi:hypothetical protein